MTIINEEKELKYHRPYKEESLQHAPRNHNQIGTEIERTPRYSWLNRLNNHDKKRTEEREKIMQLKRILAGLNLPDKLYSSVMRRFEHYRSQIKIGTKFRAPRVLLPITLYVHCLDNEIFITREMISKAFNYHKKDFNKGLMLVLKNSPKLFKKLKSDDFRKRMILKMLSGLKCQHNYPNTFLYVAFKYIEDFFGLLKNKKNEVIAAILFYCIKEFYGNEMKECLIAHACYFLGVCPSVVNNNKHLIDKIRRHRI